MEPSLDLQKFIRTALTTHLPILPLLSPNAVMDRIGTPERFPCLLIGEGFSEHPDNFGAFFTHVTMDLHIWSSATSTTEAKQIAHEARKAILSTPATLDANDIYNIQVESARFMRDPDGRHHHAILTVTAILQERCH